MDTSFYTAVRGTMTQQQHMDVLANNIANINTIGYKTKNGVFQDLIYSNLHAAEDADVKRQAGTGAEMQRTVTDFSSGGWTVTGGAWDFAIEGTGFFRIREPGTNAEYYTRAGNFQLSSRSDGFYLADAQANLVLDAEGNPIRYEDGELSAQPGIYDFRDTWGMRSIGNNNFTPIARNGQPTLAAGSRLLDGRLEDSNVDLATEMAKVIESSRAYSYILKMVQVSDEVEQTINGLR